MVSVKLLSAPPPVTSYSLEYLDSSSERTSLALAGAMPSTRISVRLGRIGLVDLRKAQVGRLQILLDAPHRVVGFGVDRFLDLHLQDQVSAAAQIQAQVNALGHGLQQGLAAEARRHPEDAVDANHQDRNNQGNFVVEILLHRPVSLLQCSEIQCQR